MKTTVTTLEMEVALAEYFNFRQKLVVPNVSWGLRLLHKPLHECDLLVLTKSSYLWEVEIKVTKSDLIADKKKRHGHNHPALKRLYFAIPKELEECGLEHIPERAGVLVVGDDLVVTEVRSSAERAGYKLSAKEIHKLAWLGAMRVWGLKSKLLQEVA